MLPKPRMAERKLVSDIREESGREVVHPIHRFVLDQCPNVLKPIAPAVFCCRRVRTRNHDMVGECVSVAAFRP
jgi:hypothetical protein